MITKFANIEAILEVKSSSDRLAYNYDEAKGLRFAKFAAMDEGIREEDGYLYVRCRAISSRVNKNNDGWPSKELDKSYKTFESRPIFVDHNNDNPKRTRGVIVASEIHVDTDKEAALDPYYSNAPEEHLPATWIELLLEVDAKTYPKLAENIREGKIDAVSMGANIDRSVCSVCAHEATVPSEYCTHIKKKGTTFEVTSGDGEKIKKKAYEDCYGINFFEISFVFDPADPTADVLSKKGSTEKKYSEERIHELATANQIPFNELAAYLETQGQYDGPRGATTLEYIESNQPLSEMVGRTLPMERVASLKRSVPLAEQFMVPKGQDPATDGKDKNYKPQSEMITAPQHVDTLRNDQRCPVCHAAEMETGADGINSCPVCGHVQEPEPLNNPDLGIARDNMLRQDATPEGEQVTPVNGGDPLDTIQFDQDQAQQPQAQPTSKKSITDEGISEMFTTTLRTTSKEEADAILPAKVARVEAKLGHGVHRGIYDAARTAGLKVKVAYPAVKSTEENSVEVPGDNGIFNLFFAEESALNLGVAMEEVPVVIEAATTADAEKFLKILAETPLPSRRRKAENNKQPILPNSKPSDEPKKETVIENPTEPVESKLKAAVTIDGIVELDGIKYRLEEIKDETEDETDESKKDEPKEDSKAEEKEEKEDEKDSSEDREARLLAAFKLADLSVEMGLVLPENKMAFIAELEEESLEQLNVREATLNSVKTAGFSKRVASHPLQGIKRVPRLSHAVPALNGSGSQNNDVPDEALFL